MGSSDRLDDGVEMMEEAVSSPNCNLAEEELSTWCLSWFLRQRLYVTEFTGSEPDC